MAPTPDCQKDLDRARANSDALFQLIDPDAMYDRPIPERHRIIFYLGHLDAFDWNLVGRRGLDLPPIHPDFERLFERGIDPEPGRLPSDGPDDWPSVDEVQKYRAKVREKVDSCWQDAPLEIRLTAIEHREMHAETFAYIMHNLPVEKKIAPPVPRAPACGRAAGRMIEIPAGSATLGRSTGFGWDNEFREHSVMTPAFSIGKHKVTNGEFLNYMQATGAGAPYFWKCREREWVHRGMFAEFPLPLDWPVYVTQRQAAAYARWNGKSLPTEAQFHRAAYGTPSGEERSLPWGNGEDSRGNLDYRRWDPVPVNATPVADSAFGVSQLVGNGWEWTSTVFAPFAGFEPRPYYPGYSADFFDHRHYVLKGASPRTVARLARRSFRNWFRPEYPYIYAGFRLVEN